MNYSGFTRPVCSWLRDPQLCDVPVAAGHPAGIYMKTGKQMVQSMQTVHSGISWRSLRHSWNLVDSHDSLRVRTMTGSFQKHVVAVGLQATLPGVPMIFAGSEFALKGWNGESSRTPMPWNRESDQDHATLQQYKMLFDLRTKHEALIEGSLRWLLVDDDQVIFARETFDHCIIIRAARAPVSAVSLSLLCDLQALYAASNIERANDGTVQFAETSNAAFAIWKCVHK
jgi:alpha-glucosidase